MTDFKRYSMIMGLSLLLLPVGAMAQQPPDSGDILRETMPDTLAPMPPSVEMDIDADSLQDAKPGGPAIVLQGINLRGNSVFSNEELLALVADSFGTEMDMAGLRNIANRISRYYRNNDYPFARAIIPQQRMEDGVLELVVYEGIYGKVETIGEGKLADQTQPFLNKIKPGSVITGSALERITLILGDQPGITAVPVMRPGSQDGTGDLGVRVSARPRVSGGVSYDNHGSRHSGTSRGSVHLSANRLLMLGDQLTLRGMYSEEDLWLGQLAYALPLGYSGLRGRVSYARTEYDLANPYSGFTGVADIASVGVSYPLLRSQRSNLVASLTYQYKEMDDRFNGNSYQKKRSNSLPIALQFDHRDRLGGGGVSYGSLTLTPGNIRNNVVGANDGSFTRTNLQLNRLQALPANLSLFVSASGQWTWDELDSSENFTLGGAHGIRAFPQGEASGARGWLSQVELRYLYQNLSPFLFYDLGQRPAYLNDDRRTLAGGGFGLRYNNQRVQAEMSLAFKSTGGDAESDDKQRNPRIWVSLGVSF